MTKKCCLDQGQGSFIQGLLVHRAVLLSKELTEVI